MEHNEPIKTVLTKPKDMNSSNFMVENELKVHELDVPDLYPFDVHISFDWKAFEYHIALNMNEVGYSVKQMQLLLPDIIDPIKIELEASNKFQQSIKLENEPEALLVQHNFDLKYYDQNANLRTYRGFLLENNAYMRRVEHFDSLDEIFTNLINGRPFEDNPNSSLREVFTRNDHDWLQEQDAASKQEQIHSPTLSYFRLFQAMEDLEQRIIESHSEAMIEQYAFVLPGCLAEIKTKVYEEIKNNANVFNWYMRQEFNLVVVCTAKKVKDEQLRKRINSLRIKSSDPAVRKAGKKGKIGAGKYREKIKDKCNYVSI